MDTIKIILAVLALVAFTQQAQATADHHQNIGSGRDTLALPRTLSPRSGPWLCQGNVR